MTKLPRDDQEMKTAIQAWGPTGHLGAKARKLRPLYMNMILVSAFMYGCFLTKLGPVLQTFPQIIAGVIPKAVICLHNQQAVVLFSFLGLAIVVVILKLIERQCRSSTHSTNTGSIEFSPYADSDDVSKEKRRGFHQGCPSEKSSCKNYNANKVVSLDLVDNQSKTNNDHINPLSGLANFKARAADSACDDDHGHSAQQNKNPGSFISSDNCSHAFDKKCDDKKFQMDPRSDRYTDKEYDDDSKRLIKSHSFTFQKSNDAKLHRSSMNSILNKESKSDQLAEKCLNHPLDCGYNNNTKSGSCKKSESIGSEATYVSQPSNTSGEHHKPEEYSDKSVKSDDSGHVSVSSTIDNQVAILGCARTTDCKADDKARDMSNSSTSEERKEPKSPKNGNDVKYSYAISEAIDSSVFNFLDWKHAQTSVYDHISTETKQPKESHTLRNNNNATTGSEASMLRQYPDTPEAVHELTECILPTKNQERSIIEVEELKENHMPNQNEYGSSSVMCISKSVTVKINENQPFVIIGDAASKSKSEAGKTKPGLPSKACCKETMTCPLDTKEVSVSTDNIEFINVRHSGTTTSGPFMKKLRRAQRLHNETKQRVAGELKKKLSDWRATMDRYKERLFKLAREMEKKDQLLGFTMSNKKVSEHDARAICDTIRHSADKLEHQRKLNKKLQDDIETKASLIASLGEQTSDDNNVSAQG